METEYRRVSDHVPSIVTGSINVKAEFDKARFMRIVLYVCGGDAEELFRIVVAPSRYVMLHRPHP